MTTALDHLVIAAATLDEGVAFVADKLGVQIPFGGEHKTMGTHNHLMRLGGSVFLEVVAINPHGDLPPQPRWFGLDDPFVKQQLEHGPALITWVANTPDLKALVATANVDLGVVTAVSRGDLNWLFALPADGRLLASGMLPYLMQWQTDVHPSVNMADLGRTLEGVEIIHPYPQWFAQQLDAIGTTDLVTVSPAAVSDPPVLIVNINTPAGLCTLHSLSQQHT